MTTTTLELAGGMFEIEQEGDTLIIVPTVNLRELDYERIEAGGKVILELLNDTGIKNVILDFAKTDYYGSSALSLFVTLWQAIKGCGGRMVFCNVSCHEQEILQVAHLDHTWPICKSRSEALATVSARPESSR